jgi:hypothetical protein
VGKPVKAIFTVANFAGSETAVVTVSECNADGSQKAVDQVRVPVGRTDGDVEVEWTRTPEQAEGDLIEDENEGDAGPLEYRFEVETGKVRSEESSGQLWLTNTVDIFIQSADDTPSKDANRVVLVDAEGEREQEAKSGKATFDDVVIGVIKVAIND